MSSVGRDAKSLSIWAEFDSDFATLLIKMSEFTTLLTKISEFIGFVKSEF